jgi:maltose phosphorylase
LDDYNNEVSEGCHITSMAGTWLSIVEGFGGKRVEKGMLALNPQIPAQWKLYAFKIFYRGSLMYIKVSQDNVMITNEKGNIISFLLYGNRIELSEGETFKSINKNSKSNKVLT